MMNHSKILQPTVNVTAASGITVSKSFGSTLNSPYLIPHIKSLQHQRSVESPYTSLGSAQSSYASISNIGSYDHLKSKAEHASQQHESKSKAVMEALKSLQSKIRRLDADRAHAETNLKSIAMETKDYKELLMKQSVDSPSNQTQSKELEGQLELAQNKCTHLEKQLEYMRQMMRNNVSPSTPKSVTLSPGYTSTMTPSLTGVSSPYDSRGSARVTTQLVGEKSPVAVRKHAQPISENMNSPAIEKLNELEKEHHKLTAAQNMAESKIQELEEKIREEKHHRKMLQDKAVELQQAVAINRIQSSLTGAAPKTEEKKKGRRKKKKTRCSSTKSKAAPTKELDIDERHPHSPHYLCDFNNIPFVVGQSTARSHSLGANIQNVLSIMKSHNNFCHEEFRTEKSDDDPRKPSTPSVSDKDLRELLLSIQDEFAQLGFEHRELMAQLHQAEENTASKLEKELEQVVEKMETKGRQIKIIRDHLKIWKEKKVKKKNSESNKELNTIKISPSKDIEVITTVRTKPNKNTEPKSNPNLEMFKNVRKLQSTLRRTDLSWE